MYQDVKSYSAWKALEGFRKDKGLRRLGPGAWGPRPPFLESIYFNDIVDYGNEVSFLTDGDLGPQAAALKDRPEH